MAQDKLQLCTRLVKRHFGFLLADAELLFSEYDAQAYGGYALVFQAGELRIRFTRDRGAIYLMLGPVWATAGWSGGPWHALCTVISLLIGEQVFVTDYVGRMWQNKDDEQLKRLARAFRFYHHAIVDLFKADAFLSQEAALDRIYGDYISVVSHGSRSRAYLTVWRRSEQFWERFLNPSEKEIG
jgi:hypothetical protein